MIYANTFEQSTGINSLDEVVDNVNKWIDKDGNIIWPPDDGFAEAPYAYTLEKDTLIDKYGYEGGTFVAPVDTPYGERALAPGTEKKPYNKYKVLISYEVNADKIAPWFDEVGGGIQYKLDKSVKDLIDGGYRERVN